MPVNHTSLTLNSILPLTCTRQGTCCHGNLVRLNPWELSKIAKAKGMSALSFQEKYTDKSGTILLFNGKKDHRNLAACSQFDSSKGCNVHQGRPLACRLFPLGRKIQNEETTYFFEGEKFPCLNGCSEVLNLPKLTVETYLGEQETADFEFAQNAYLELMQNLADLAFELYLDTDLVKDKSFKTLKTWKSLAQKSPQDLREYIGNDLWLTLISPNFDGIELDVQQFIAEHQNQLFQKIQLNLNELKSNADLYKNSCLLMALAFLLSHAVGAETLELADLWIEIAKENGGQA